MKMAISIDYKSLEGNFGKNFGKVGARPITGFVGNPGHNILNKSIKKHELKKIHVYN